MSKGLYLGVYSTSILPTGYTQVEYIEANGTQYIDTGFIPNHNSRMIVDFSATDTTVNTNNIIGSRSSSTSKAFTFSIIQGYWRIGYGSASPTTTTAADMLRHIAEVNKNVLSLDGNVIHTASENTFTGWGTIYVGAINANTTTKYMAYAKYYSCQIYDNDTLIRNLIPCKNSSGTFGMYDLINHTFYTNSGTGNFIAGNDVVINADVARKVKKMYLGVGVGLPSNYTQLEYIKSTGTQYINSLIKPDQGTSVQMDVRMTEAPSSFAAYFGARKMNNKVYFALMKANSTKTDLYWEYGANYQNAWVIDYTVRRKIATDGSTATVDGTSLMLPTATFSIDLDLYLLASNDDGTANAITPSEIYSCTIYQNGALVRDFVPCINPSGVIGLYDTVSASFFGNAGTGTFIAGAEVQDGNVAHKIKKAYIGDASNIARLFYISQLTGSISVDKTSITIEGKGKTATATLTYIGNGTITATSSNTSIITVSVSGNTVTITAVKSGSATVTISIAETDDYSGDSCGISITVNASISYYGTATDLSVARRYMAATTVGNYALFGGGDNGSSSGIKSTVDAYNASLTHSVPTSLGGSRSYLAATTVGNYALFGGGETSSASQSAVYAYNKSLTRSTPTALSKARSYLEATTVGNYALFAGGDTSSAQTIVDAYNTSLTRSTPTGLNASRENFAATTVGSYALFAGSTVSSGWSTVDAYNTSLTRSTPTGLNVGRYALSATTVGSYALFGGGVGVSLLGIIDTVEAYNTSLTHSVITALSEARSSLAATTVGNYALFGGGDNDVVNVESATVDAYDTSLTRSTPTVLSKSRYGLAATTVGNYALFGGGYTYTEYATVDVYEYA